MDKIINKTMDVNTKLDTRALFEKALNVKNEMPRDHAFKIWNKFLEFEIQRFVNIHM